MKGSIAISIFVQGYIALLGILMMPVYLRHLGPEAFGLVGIFLMAQAWIQILDMGFTPALSREITRMRAGALSRYETASRLRALERLMGGLALGVMVLLGITHNLIAQHWIRAHKLDHDTIALCIILIGVAVSLRWYAGLYRGILTGLEQQYRVSLLLAGFATLRFVGIIPVMIYVAPTPEVFFEYQALASIMELLVNRSLARDQVLLGSGAPPRFASLNSMLPLVGSMMFLNITWVASSQLDKFILSGMLNLRDYGNFTLASVVAGGVHNSYATDESGHSTTA